MPSDKIHGADFNSVTRSDGANGMAGIAAHLDAALTSDSMPGDSARRAQLDSALEFSNTGALSEDGMALAFAEQNKDLRYVAIWGR